MEESSQKESSNTSDKKHLVHRLSKGFSAMKHRNYRLWFWGQLVSIFGTWMQLTAQGFLIYQLTHSSVYLGLIGFAAGVPFWLFTLYGGVISDRIQRRYLLIATQSAMMILAFVMAILTFAGIIQPWHILVLAFLNGIANAFDAPARQAFMFDVVPKEDLANAVVMNGTMFNISTMLGPAVGGLFYAIAGPGWCFTINGISFLAIIVGLLMMSIPRIEKARPQTGALEELREGLHYVRHHPVIMGIVLMMAVGGLLGLSFLTLIPAWSVEMLKGDATTNGLLQAGRGVGALVMALYIISLGNFKYKGRLIEIGSIAGSLLIILFAFTRTVALSFIVLVGVGMSFLLVNNLSTVLTQMHTEDRLRGRVMGAYTFVFFGFMPLGSLWVGAAASWIGEQWAIIICGALTLITSVLIFRAFPQMTQAE